MERIFKSVFLWFDASAEYQESDNPHRINWLRASPYLLIYAACFGVFFVGVSYEAIVFCLVSYALRVFSLTAFYHRYFSHRAFKTSRVVQFIFAFIGASAAQRGPLWWASHHRHHHAHSDTPEDKHSPIAHGFIRSHFTWFIEDANFATNDKLIKDFAKYPELVFINRYDFLPPVVYATIMYLLGGWQALIWGYFISTVLVYQVTFSVNSIAHLFGKRRYETADHSRNNWWLALLTFGEGWHNNHHYYPSSARQGFLPHQIDISYYILKLLAMFGLITDLRVPSREIIDAEA